MRMKRIQMWMPALAIALLSPALLFAQPEEKTKEKSKEKKEVQQIVITRKGDKKDKVVVEINNDKITINGKPIEDYKEGEIKVITNNLKDMESLTFTTGGDAFSFTPRASSGFRTTFDNNRAMLGVSTEKDEKGVKVNNVTDESAAEKIGLKEGDVITKIGDTKVEDPDDLTKTITSHKPGDKVTVTWLRDNKEQKATAELTKWKGMSGFGTTSPLVREFRMESDGKSPAFPDMRELQELNRFKVFEAPMGQNWSWSGNGPKLGLSVQDTDDGKGVKVIEVDEESNAGKAGLKEEDLITEIDGKAVNSTDETVKIIKESKEKTSIMVKLSRGGKTMNIEVKMPRKIKTADL
jgi:serine protease Do